MSSLVWRLKLAVFCPVWPWKQKGTFSMLFQALCIISQQSVNSKWSYSPETLKKIGQNRWFLSRVNLKFDGWPPKIKGHCYAISSFVYHFIGISKFKMEIKSGNAKFGSKSKIFVPCDLEIWQMTLKNDRATLLCHLKLCASFHSHLWIQISVTIRKQLS